LPSPQPGNNPPNKWVPHPAVLVAMPLVVRWAAWRPVEPLVPAHLGCKRAARVPLVARWVEPLLEAKWLAVWEGKWVVRVPQVARWQVAWAHPVDKWLAVWVAPVDKWAARAHLAAKWQVAWVPPAVKWVAWA